AEEAPAEESEDDLKVGMRVKALDDDDSELGKGEVVSIDEESAEVTVKLDTGKKVIVPVDKLRLLPKEEPKKAGGLKLRK
ncbi:hypothetical protein KW797_03325, partial [Candidatus Parcubacteria bacterium]|nr:hypothetical protein [Candidatus Parcubacteria bacterium]